MKLLMHEDKNNHLILYDNIDSEILEKASEAAFRIQALLENLAFGESIQESLDELKETCLLNPLNPLNQVNQYIQHRRIERKAKAFLSEFFIILNHWEKKAKNQGCVDKFKELTHLAYDEYEEYGFIYNLRNYAIHCNNVVNSIHGEIGCKYIIPLSNRDLLISNYSKWKSQEKKFISKQPQYFNLLPIFEKGCKVILDIHHSMMDYQLTQQTISDCSLLIDLYEKIKKLNKEQGIWDIIEFLDDKNSPIDKEKIPMSSGCNRSYINWAVYPYIKNRAEIILNRQHK